MTLSQWRRSLNTRADEAWLIEKGKSGPHTHSLQVVLLVAGACWRNKCCLTLSSSAFTHLSACMDPELRPSKEVFLGGPEEDLTTQWLVMCQKGCWSTLIVLSWRVFNSIWQSGPSVSIPATLNQSGCDQMYRWSHESKLLHCSRWDSCHQFVAWWLQRLSFHCCQSTHWIPTCSCIHSYQSCLLLMYQKDIICSLSCTCCWHYSDLSQTCSSRRALQQASHFVYQRSDQMADSHPQRHFESPSLYFKAVAQWSIAAARPQWVCVLMPYSLSQSCSVMRTWLPEWRLYCMCQRETGQTGRGKVREIGIDRWMDGWAQWEA